MLQLNHNHHHVKKRIKKNKNKKSKNDNDNEIDQKGDTFLNVEDKANWMKTVGSLQRVETAPYGQI